MGIDRFDFKGIAGEMRALYIPVGETNPNNINIKADKEPLVCFYDLRYMYTPDGQHISSYYVDTILRDWLTKKDVENVGLDLLGYVPSWKINADEMNKVRAWLRGK